MPEPNGRDAPGDEASMVGLNQFIEFTAAMEQLAEGREIDLHGEQARTSLFDEIVSLLDTLFDPFIPDPSDIEMLRARFDRWVAEKKPH